MLKILIFLTLILSFPLYAESSFNQGLEAFQKGDYDSAQRTFLTFLNTPSLKFDALYNLGVLAAKTKKPGEALGYFRRAQKINPRDRDLLQNIRLVTEQFNILPPAGEISALEVFRSEILNNMTFYEVSLIAAALFIFFVTRFLAYFKKRLASEEKLLPPASVYVWGALVLVGFSLVALKIIDSYSERATITVAKAELKSGPDSNTATLAEINEGTEVEVKDTATDTSGGWKQVAIPGNLTGWISDKSLMVTSGEGPW